MSMTPLPPRLRPSLTASLRLVVASLAGIVMSLPAPADLSAEESLVPARFESVTDSRDFTWDVNPYGAIQTGTDNIFNGAQVLRVNGRIFNPQSRQMLADGRELVLSGSVGDLSVTRRIRVLPDLAACRYLEVVENTGEEPAEATISLLTQLRRPASGLFTDDGAPLGETLAEGQAGFGAQPDGQGITPIFIVAGRVGPRPDVRNNRNYQFTVTYEAVTLPPGAKVAVVHAVAQRRDTDPSAIRQHMGPVLAAMLAGTDIPASLRPAVVNLGGTEIRSGETAAIPRDDMRLTRLLAAEIGASRNEQDHLLLGGSDLLHGELTGEAITISTDSGDQTYPFTAVAAIMGGAGAGRPQRLFLRDGSVLSGTITAPGLRMTTDQGWDIEPDPAEFQALIFRSAAEDGIRDASVSVTINTHDGRRIAVTNASADLALGTPWGPASINLNQVDTYRYQIDPRPSYELQMVDGTTLPVLPGGGEITVNSVHLGEVTLPLHQVAAIERVPTASEEPAVDVGGNEPTTTQATVSAQGDSIPLGTLLSDIGEQAGLPITLASDLIPVIGEQKVALNISDIPLRTLAVDIARTFALDVSINNDGIVLRRRPEAEQAEPDDTVTLRSGHVISGTTAVEGLSLVTTTGTISIASEELTALVRDRDTGTATATLHNGQGHSGRLSDPTITIATAIGEFALPVDQIVEWRRHQQPAADASAGDETNTLPPTPAETEEAAL